MLETPHVVIGIAIASKIPNPLISIPLAFASHFVLELVPHWNPHLNTEVKKHGSLTKNTVNIIMADVAVSIALGSFFAYQAMPNTIQALNILACSFSAVLPDVVEGPYFLFGVKSKIIEKWIKIQKAIQNDTNIYFGLLTQGVTILTAFWWIFN